MPLCKAHRLLVILLALLLLGGCTPPQGAAPEPEEDERIVALQQSIAELTGENQRLNSANQHLQAQLHAARADAEAARIEQEGLAAETAAAEFALNEERRQVRRLENNLNTTLEELGRVRAQMAELEGQRIGVSRHALGELPREVREWAELYRDVAIGATMTHGNRTYLLVSLPSSAPGEHRLDCCGVVRRGDRLEATASLYHVAPEHRRAGEHIAVASIAATGLPVEFEVREWWLPALRNPHGLPQVALPADRKAVLVEPAEGAALGAEVRVAGYASRLFEGTVVARIVTADDVVVAEKPTTAAGGMGPDWGSFVLQWELPGADLPAGSLFVEIGDYSPKDGAWELFDRVRVRRP